MMNYVCYIDIKLFIPFEIMSFYSPIVFQRFSISYVILLYHLY